MKMSSAFPSNYLKASDLNGREATVNIASVAMEDIGGDHKPVIYFQGKEKGMVLNKTNANNIVAMYGDDTENWFGQPICLFSTWVDFQGKSVEAIRVKPVPRQPAQPAEPAPAGVMEQPAPGAPVGGGALPEDDIPFAPCKD